VAIRASHTLKTAPAEPSITIEEAKLQLKLEEDFGDEDDLIETILFAADRMVENRTSRSLIQGVYEYVADQWDCNYCIKLWPGNLVEVASVEYWDTSNVLQTLSTNDYEVDTRSKPGRIWLKTTPSLYDRHDAILITYTVGYGASGDDAEAQRAAIPSDLKAWLKLQIATLYENRQVFLDGVIGLNSIQTYSDHLIFPYVL
jgi:uncharacterized phiE125 gp8 family phage protein